MTEGGSSRSSGEDRMLPDSVKSSERKAFSTLHKPRLMGVVCVCAREQRLC